MISEVETADALQNWIPVIVQGLITVGAIFGGAGFWTWKQNKDQAKRDAEEKKNGAEGKIDKLSDQATEMSEKMTGLTNKVDILAEEVQDLKHDIILLQKANEETVKYREQRAQRDELDSIERRAIIESLCGMMRERLLDNYKRCIKKGYYTREEREIYGEMFECYEKAPFNGDGVMHDLRPIMKDLPWTAEEAGILNDEDSED